jgi:hypothetical protein
MAVATRTAAALAAFAVTACGVTIVLLFCRARGRRRAATEKIRRLVFRASPIDGVIGIQGKVLAILERGAVYQFPDMARLDDRAQIGGL